MSASVARISIAPVKALRLVHPAEVVLGRDGVEGDRRFWLVDEAGVLYNGKRDGRLQRIRVEWDETARRLALELPDGRRVEGAVEPGEPVAAEMFRRRVVGRRVEGPWQEALAAFLGRRVSLLWADRPLVDRSSLGGGVSLVSSASLRRLAEQGGANGALDGRRFRMLFEVDGLAAHEEDGWIGRRVRIGDAVVELAGDVGRCVVTTRDPETGVVDFPTLRALAGYRREGVREPLPFGVYGSVVEPGRVRVGDAVAPE